MVSSSEGSFFASESIRDKIDMSQFETSETDDPPVDLSDFFIVDLEDGSQVKTEFLAVDFCQDEVRITMACWNPEDIKKIMSSCEASYCISLSGQDVLSGSGDITNTSVRIANGAYLLEIAFSSRENT